MYMGASVLTNVPQYSLSCIALWSNVAVYDSVQSIFTGKEAAITLSLYSGHIIRLMQRRSYSCERGRYWWIMSKNVYGCICCQTTTPSMLSIIALQQLYRPQVGDRCFSLLCTYNILYTRAEPPHHTIHCTQGVNIGVQRWHPWN